jgi:hypothetical protein
MLLSVIFIGLYIIFHANSYHFTFSALFNDKNIEDELKYSFHYYSGMQIFNIFFLNALLKKVIKINQFNNLFTIFAAQIF